MTRTRLWGAAASIALIVILGFLFFTPHTYDSNEGPKALATAQTPQSVTVHDVYKKGVHSITGTLLAPDPCVSLSASAMLTGASTTPHILITIVMPADTGVCLQVPQTMSFSTTINAPPHIPIETMVNGVAATTSAA